MEASILKKGINLYIEVEIIKKCQKKGIKMSDIAEEAFRNALNPELLNLKAGSPEKSLLGTWLRLPYKYRKKATNIFMQKNKGLLPNFERTKHIEDLLKTYSKIVKQTKISLKPDEKEK